MCWLRRTFLRGTFLRRTFLRSSVCKGAGEDELAVRPETEQCAQADPEKLGDVVGELGVQVEHVSRDSQADDRDDHGDSVEEHEQRQLMGGLPVAAVTKRPETVAEPGHQRRRARREDQSSQRFVVEERFVL